MTSAIPSLMGQQEINKYKCSLEYANVMLREIQPYSLQLIKVKHNYKQEHRRASAITQLSVLS